MKNEISEILEGLSSGLLNRRECSEQILMYLSDNRKVFREFKEGNEILYKGNVGKLISIGRYRSRIQYYLLGYVKNEQSYFDKEVYNIEINKCPKNYFQ